jgi:tetratricopeptide (TPR) repeat protein
MSKLPFEIPQSLASYVDHFQKEPDQAINRLKKQLKKRGSDAVGHFLLAWFYHLRDLNDLAVEEAHKARIFAPGSPFFRKLHYYFSHPNTFEAWTPNDERNLNTTSPSVDTTTPLSDLDSLIERLTAVESNPIRIDEYQEADSNGTGEQDEAVTEENIDSIASETLAAIHEQQGKTEAAIRTYRQLKQLRKEKTAHYNKQINRLRKISREKKEKQ